MFQHNDTARHKRLFTATAENCPGHEDETAVTRNNRFCLLPAIKKPRRMPRLVIKNGVTISNLVLMPFDSLCTSFQ